MGAAFLRGESRGVEYPTGMMRTGSGIADLRLNRVIRLADMHTKMPEVVCGRSGM